MALLPSLAAPMPAQTAAITEINKILVASGGQLTQQHLADFEDWLVVLLTGSELKQWVTSLRDDYRDAFGVEALQRILPTLVPQVNAASDADLLAEARRLQSELHWQYSLQPWARQKREEMMTDILITLIVVVVVASYLGGKGMFSAVLALLGTLGGSISSIQRVQAADFTNSRAVSMARQQRFALGVILSPLQGACFAIIFTLVLVAGVVTPGFVVPTVCLQGADRSSFAGVRPPVMAKAANSVAPASTPRPQPPMTGSNGVSSAGTNGVNTENGNAPAAAVPTVGEVKKADADTGTGAVGGRRPELTQRKEPKEALEQGRSASMESSCRFPFFNMMLSFGSGKDVALLLLWAFIAGFSERLVPDLLSRMAEKGKA